MIWQAYSCWPTRCCPRRAASEAGSVELTPAGATVRGPSAAVVLDGRAAAFAVGSNGALGARYVVLDSFVDQDAIVP